MAGPRCRGCLFIFRLLVLDMDLCIVSIQFLSSIWSYRKKSKCRSARQMCVLASAYNRVPAAHHPSSERIACFSALAIMASADRYPLRSHQRASAPLPAPPPLPPQRRPNRPRLPQPAENSAAPAPEDVVPASQVAAPNTLSPLSELTPAPASPPMHSGPLDLEEEGGADEHVVQMQQAGARPLGHLRFYLLTWHGQILLCGSPQIWTLCHPIFSPPFGRVRTFCIVHV